MAVKEQDVELIVRQILDQIGLMQERYLEPEFLLPHM